MVFDQEKFNSFLVAEGFIGFFENPITLKSGRQSYWYANLRNSTKDIETKDKLIGFILDFVEDNSLEPDFFYGVPEGATKTALFATDTYAKGKGKNALLVMGRGKPKEHGAPKDKYFIGNIPEGSNIVVIEDVTTTGGSLLSALEVFKQMDVNILCAVGLVNRNELRDDKKSVKEKVEELGIKYLCMANAVDLLPIAAKDMNPSPEILKKVEEGFERYGVQPLKF